MEWIIKPCATPGEGGGAPCTSKCGLKVCASKSCHGYNSCSQQCVMRIK